MKKMTVILESSMMNAASHIDDKLRVEFNSGHVYEYTGVTREQFLEFIQADSQGKYFHEHFRNLPNKSVGFRNL